MEATTKGWDEVSGEEWLKWKDIPRSLWNKLEPGQAY